MFCEIFRTQNHTLYTLRLVSLWGRPEHTQLPNTLHSTQHTLQEAALRPRDFRRPPYSPERLPYSPETSGGRPTAQRLPYSPETAPTVSPAYPTYPAYPAYPSFRQSIPLVPSVPSKHTDYKTTRLQILPANRKHNKTPRRGKYRKSLTEANTEK